MQLRGIRASFVFAPQCHRPGVSFNHPHSIPPSAGTRLQEEEEEEEQKKVAWVISSVTGRTRPSSLTVAQPGSTANYS